MKLSTKRKLIAIMNTHKVFSGEDIYTTSQNIYNLYRDDYIRATKVFSWEYNVNHEDMKALLELGKKEPK